MSFSLVNAFHQALAKLICQVRVLRLDGLLAGEVVDVISAVDMVIAKSLQFHSK